MGQQMNSRPLAPSWLTAEAEDEFMQYFVPRLRKSMRDPYRATFYDGVAAGAALAFASLSYVAGHEDFVLLMLTFSIWLIAMRTMTIATVEYMLERSRDG